MGAASTGMLTGYVGYKRQQDNGLSQSSVNVLLTYFPDMVFSPMTGAKAFGYFEKVGLNVNIRSTVAVQNPLQILASGNADITVTTPFDYIVGRARELPLETVVTTVGKTPLSYASMGKSNINGVQDWPGNTLGLQNETDRNWVTPAILSEEGLSEAQRNRIRQTFIGYSVTNLTANKVNIMSLYPTNSDFNSLRINGTEFNLVEARNYTTAPGNCAVTTTQFAEEHPDTVTEFTRAWAKAANESLKPSNKNRFAKMVLGQLRQANADVFLQGVDPLAVERSNFEQFLKYRPIDAWQRNGVGWNNPSDYLAAQQLGVSAGGIDQGATLSESNVVSNQFVNAVYTNGKLDWPQG
ncbi:ABC transporter substrate-binding protein [Haladaptatus halobius]|uniref:ABC transporter substrate-binding protein n=1 Tax=Haladaptatus halobius TaxID=2884875 RepID=UPI001D0BCBD4|nr:ABC transporter substrate-binding protein [Haladaptatus halobius]